MLTHVAIQAHVVWDDILWSVRAMYQEAPTEAPVVLTKSGQTPMTDDDSPEGVLAAVTAAIARGDMLEEQEGLDIALSAGDSIPPRT